MNRHVAAAALVLLLARCDSAAPDAPVLCPSVVAPYLTVDLYDLNTGAPPAVAWP